MNLISSPLSAQTTEGENLFWIPIKFPASHGSLDIASTCLRFFYEFNIDDVKRSMAREHDDSTGKVFLEKPWVKSRVRQQQTFFDFFLRAYFFLHFFSIHWMNLWFSIPFIRLIICPSLRCNKMKNEWDSEIHEFFYSCHQLFFGLQ